MRRTQIMLTEKQHKTLSRLSKASNRPRSEIIREALDKHLPTLKARREWNVRDWKKAITAAAGIWKDRPEVEEEIAEARRSADRDIFAESNRLSSQK